MRDPPFPKVPSGAEERFGGCGGIRLMPGIARARRDKLAVAAARSRAPEGHGAPSRRLALVALLLLLPALGLVLLAGAQVGPQLALAAGLALLALAGLLAGAALRDRHSTTTLASLEARLAEAEAARCQAEEESLAKSRFLAEMSHELRTPLNTVMGFSEMMAQEVLGPHRIAAYKGYAHDIHDCGQHLLALADDLLDLARIESGHRVLLETSVRLDLLAQDCLAMMAPQAGARGVGLRNMAQHPAIRLWGDERALKQMMLNLLANGVKFTPEGGEVRLLAGLGADGAPFIAVEDTGRGIAERELPLEDARHQESRLDPATGRGAGLGLAIVQGLAGLHGGAFALARRPGGGTSATVTFPAARASLAPEAPARATPELCAQTPHDMPAAVGPMRDAAA